jgi:hypothetical protein
MKFRHKANEIHSANAVRQLTIVDARKFCDSSKLQASKENGLRTYKSTVELTAMKAKVFVELVRGTNKRKLANYSH